MSQYIASFAILVLYLVLQAFHPTCSNSTGFSMKMILRDSPGSPLYPGNLTELQRIERLVKFSKARANYLKASRSSNTSVVNPQDEAEMALFRLEFTYFVSFEMGDPPLIVYLVMDTGSSVMWTQCMPCDECYKQSVTTYNSSASSTFANLPCSGTSLCSGPGAPFKCVENECKFAERYMSGETAEGDVATETIRCLHGKEGVNTVTNVIFGCARKTTGHNLFKETPVGGIMGISFAPESMVSQLSDIANGRFSYCLFPITSDGAEDSTLSFGDAIPAPPQNALTIPMLEHPDYFDNFFYLDVRDISVGPRRLGLVRGSFGFSGQMGGFIIDTGSAMTYLAEIQGNPYRRVITAFQEYYDSKEGLVRVTVSNLECCYRYPDGFNEFVSMTYHFNGGTDHFVEARYVSFFADIDGKFFCVGILPGDKSSILGAVHQQNTRFTFDANTNTLQFYGHDCS